MCVHAVCSIECGATAATDVPATVQASAQLTARIPEMAVRHPSRFLCCSVPVSRWRALIFESTVSKPSAWRRLGTYGEGEVPTMGDLV